MRLPDWVEEIRPHQEKAIMEILDQYRLGKDLVVLDAPTGSGKTLIGEVVRQSLGVPRSSYVCSSLTLQDQFAADFPYAKVMKGRDNYPTTTGKMNASHCRGVGCGLCVSKERCPYQEAMVEASAGELACLNSTFQLYQSNYGQNFRKRDFLVFDECDELEGQLMGFAQVSVGKKAWARVGMSVPRKGIRYTTLLGHLQTWEAKARDYLKTMPDGKDRRSWQGTISAVRRALELWDTVEFVRQDSPGVLLKPITVDAWSEQLWRGDRFLLMSATVISPTQMLRDLGWNADYGYVEVPMTFPVENRTIHALPEVDMARKNKDVGWPQMLKQVQDIVDRHEGENVLVHTVSYELTRFLWNGLQTTGQKHAYFDAASRATTLREFKRKGGVMLAPSMDRGVDFSHDDARVVVVCKIPYPYLGDRQVSARLHAVGGQSWYTIQTIRTLVQMTGRGVRSASDHAVTYILDKQFKQLYGQNRRMFPEWWREAVRYQPPPRR